MTRLDMDHPAIALWADSLAMTSGPKRPEDIARILGHAIDATGYVLALPVWVCWEDSPDAYGAVVAAATAERAIELAQADAPHAVGRWGAERADTAAEGVLDSRSR